jgi:2-keto-4-pentenoate hydratase/2-oxohepta-3-ene-1,7-dioic acid hydratase in catechol pathway
MRLCRIGEFGSEAPAVHSDDGRLLDARSVTDDYDGAFFDGGGIDRLREALEAGRLPALADQKQRLGSPIAKPSKVVCVGLNYAAHAAESGLELPAEPPVFFKAPNAVVGPNDDVLLPVGGEKTDWEVELAIVIGSTARYLPDLEAARSVIAGYAVSNDVSERAFQLERGGQWVKGKSCETFNPLGPWLVTADEVGDPQNLRLWCSVNGRMMQDSSTSDMVVPALKIVHYLSQFMVLEPGDLINTGTPQGVGLGFKPPIYLRDGDVMELGVDGLGQQRQVCRQAVA